jgi:hypothetical protein
MQHMEIDHKHRHKLHIKYCSKVNNYKHGDAAKFWDYIWKTWHILNLYLCDKFSHNINNYIKKQQSWTCKARNLTLNEHLRNLKCNCYLLNTTTCSDLTGHHQVVHISRNCHWTNFFYFNNLHLSLSHYTTLVEAPHHKPEGRGFESWWGHWIFQLT